MPQPTPPGGARQRRKQARPQELLDAALTLFVQKGFAATRTDDVARLAGVSKGTLYLYYPSKEELFKAVVRHNITALITEGQELAGSFSGSSAALLSMMIHALWQRMAGTETAGIHKMMLAEVRNFPELAQFYTDEVIIPTNQLFSGCIARGIERGEFRTLPVHAVAQALFAPLIFMALHRHSFGACPVDGCVEIDPSTMLDTHLDLILRGLVIPEGPAR